MNTPKPHPPVPVATDEQISKANENIRPSQHILDAMKEQLAEVQASRPKPKARPKPAEAYVSKNQPLKGHPGLIALKNNLEQR